MCVLDLAQEAGVVPGRLHGVGRDQDIVQGQRLQQRPEVGDLVGLAGFRDPVLGDDQARDVGDGEQVHLLVLAGLGELAFLAVHGGGAAGGHVPGIRQHGRVQPGVQRVRPEPAVPSFLPEALRGRRLLLPLLPVLIPGPLLFRAVRGVRGRDCGIERGLRDARGRAASNPSGSIISGSLPSVDADGATRSPVRGDTRQPCAASTSWPQPAAACAIASGPPSPAAVPATATETSDASWCRIPFTPRRSASRRASASRNRTGSGAAPDGKWRRMTPISHDEPTGVVQP